MDILHLIDRLEEIIKKGRRLPFGDLRVVNERRIWPLLDQMRISIPDEVRRSERIIRARERTKAQAQEEAERIVELARREAAQLTAEHNISKAAEERAIAIQERAKMTAGEIIAGADEYAYEVLCNLEQEMKRALTVIENGIRAVENRQRKREVRPDAPLQSAATDEGERNDNPVEEPHESSIS